MVEGGSAMGSWGRQKRKKKNREGKGRGGIPEGEKNSERRKVLDYGKIRKEGYSVFITNEGVVWSQLDLHTLIL